MWIGRPAADRETAQRECTDIVGLVQNASEISSNVLHALLQAQVDLVSKMSREAASGALRRQALAELAAQQLAFTEQQRRQAAAAGGGHRGGGGGNGGNGGRRRPRGHNAQPQRRGGHPVHERR